MGAPPLVALGVQPIPQPDVLGDYAKLSSLRGQQQAQSIQAQQAPLIQQGLQEQAKQQQLQTAEMQRQAQYEQKPSDALE